MGTFLQAKQRHRVVMTAASTNDELAAGLWNAIVGLGIDPDSGSFAEAVRDTLPMDHAALLATDEVAAAWAFGLLWSGTEHPPGASPFELRDVARAGWASFAEQARRASNVAEGFGWNLSAAWTQAREVELALGDMTQVERIARLAGRMYVALRGARAGKVNGVPAEVYSIEQGNDLSRLLPAEQVLLMDPDLETVVLERIATRRAAQYAVRGTTKASKGPLVIALDESSSMHAERNEWAKAAAVALSRVALEEGRSVSVVHFSTSAIVQALKPGDTKSVIAMIRHFLGGGTAIGLALGVATQEVKDFAKKGDRGADIVLVTDGVDHDESAHASAVAEARRLDMRLWTVAIECDISEESPLRSQAAQYCRVGGTGLTDGATVTLIMGAA